MKRTAQKPKLGLSTMADRPSHHQPSGRASGRIQSLQSPGEPAARCNRQAPGHSALEARSIPEVPVLPEGPVCPPVRMIKLTYRQKITPYRWVHPSEER